MAHVESWEDKPFFINDAKRLTNFVRSTLTFQKKKKSSKDNDHFSRILGNAERLSRFTSFLEDASMYTGMSDACTRTGAVFFHHIKKNPLALYFYLEMAYWLYIFAFTFLRSPLLQVCF